MRLSMGGVTRPAARFAARIAVRLTRTRWRRAMRRPATATPVALTVLATVALASITGSGPQERPATDPVASADGIAGPPRLAFTSEHLSLLAVRETISDDGGTVTTVRRLFDAFFNDYEPSATGSRMVWVGYRSDGSPYQADGDIYFRDFGIAVESQRTRDDFVDAEPAVNANGSRIVYATQRGEARDNWDIYSVSTSGDTAPTPFITGPGSDRHPSFSPDGSQVVFSSTRDDPAGDLYIRNAAGEIRRLTEDPAADGEPVWSPDGTRIAFTTSRFGEPSHIAVMPVGGGAVTDLGRGRSAAWSPDSDEIAFVDPLADPLGDIFTIPAGGGAQPTPHSTDPGRAEEHPTYGEVSEAGTQIVFATARGKNEENQDSPISTTPGPSDAPGVTPATVSHTLDPGEGFSLEKFVRTPDVAPNPDIVLLIDTTGSMGEAIGNVRANVQAVINSVRAAQPNAQFAVASYRDQFDGPNEVFNVRQQLTSSDAAVQAAVNALVADGGDDTPEDWINALVRVSDTDRINYRPDSNRIVVLIGDAESHDPSPRNAFEVENFTEAEAIAALKATNIKVVAVGVSTEGSALDRLGQATRVTQATGGRLVGGSADQVTAEILRGLGDLNVTITQRTTCDPGLTVTFDRTSVTVPGNTLNPFVETVRVAPDANQGGTLRCTVEFLLDNASAGPAFTQTVTVSVNRVLTATDIRAVDYDGTRPGEVVNDPAILERDPSWAPDGRRLVFETETTGSSGSVLNAIGIADHDGRNINNRFIVPPPVIEGSPLMLKDPAWSPDGRFVAVSRQQSSFQADAEIVIYDVTGTTPVERAVLPCTEWATPIPEPLWRFKNSHNDGDNMVEERCFDADPAWSPDSRTLAFARTLKLEEDWFVGRIFTIRVNTNGTFSGNATQVSAGTDHDERLRVRGDKSPTWSPDGQSIAYSEWINEFPETTGPNVFTALVIIRATGGGAQRVISSETNTELMDFDKPAFAPDGASLAFSAMRNIGPELSKWRPGGYDIHAININGTGLRPVYVQPGNDTDPAFQPRADLIAKLAPDPEGILVGQRSVVTLDLTNAGHHRATGVVAQLTVPAGLTPAAIRFRQPAGLTLTGPGCSQVTLRCEFDMVPPRITVPIELEVIGAVQGSHEVSATVSAQQIDPDPSDNTATTDINVDTADIAVTVVAAPVPAFVGGDAILVRYTVDNEGTGSTGPVTFTAELPATLPVRNVAVTTTGGGPAAVCADPVAGCDLGAFSPTRVVTIEVTLGPDVAVVSAAVGTVVAPASTGSPEDDTDSAPIEVRAPTLLVTPKLGKPGFVPAVVGTGFPAGAKVLLRWDRGVTSRRQFVTADAFGNFRVPMIIFHKDVRGPRIMVATHAGSEADPGPRFGAVRANTFLVTTPADQPEDWLYRR
jgi:Tol biopolymer transport system component